MKKVGKLLLFAASACHMGRTMGTVLKEVGERLPELSMDTYYIDLHIEDTNRYRIKQNPTTIFVTDEKQELYRIEGFKETEDVLHIIDLINKNQLSCDVNVEKNRETTENYVIYLYDKDSLVPVELLYTNLTSVRTPRITLIQQLLQAKVEGLVNPFSSTTELELVQFKGNKGIITLKGTGQPDTQTLSLMKRALEKSLESFGIDEVHMIFL